MTMFISFHNMVDPVFQEEHHFTKRHHFLLRNIPCQSLTADRSVRFTLRPHDQVFCHQDYKTLLFASENYLCCINGNLQLSPCQLCLEEIRHHLVSKWQKCPDGRNLHKYVCLNNSLFSMVSTHANLVPPPDYSSKATYQGFGYIFHKVDSFHPYLGRQP